MLAQYPSSYTNSPVSLKRKFEPDDYCYQQTSPAKKRHTMLYYTNYGHDYGYFAEASLACQQGLLTPPATPVSARTAVRPVPAGQTTISAGFNAGGSANGSPVLTVHNQEQYSIYQETKRCNLRSNEVSSLQTDISTADDSEDDTKLLENTLESSRMLVRKWKEGGFFMEVHYCSVCRLALENRDQLEEHIVSVHIKQRRWSLEDSACRGCLTQISPGTSTGKDPEQRRDDHESKCPSVRKYQCNTCDKRFLFKVRLNAHSRLCGQTKLPCKVCMRTFKDEHSYKYHMVMHAFV